MIEKLAYSLGRNDEEPNIDLAKELVQAHDLKGISEIVNGLEEKNLAGDCIKVLYEVGKLQPSLISKYVNRFIDLLRSRNNRLVWGAMIALSEITSLKPNEVFNNLDLILRIYKTGSVITIDNAISIFAELVKADKEYEKIVFPIIIKHLEECRHKEVGQHSERAFICVNKDNANLFKETLKKRVNELSDSQKKRVEKIISKIEKGQY